MNSVSKQAQDEYEHPTTDVIYVTTNIPGSGINPDDFDREFAVGCSCQSPCDNNVDCTCTRGTINYQNRRKIECIEPIIECNPMCACTSDCTNRLVQNGPIEALYIDKIENKGLGLFCKKLILKGAFVCEYAGEVIDLEEARNRIRDNERTRRMNYVLIFNEFVGQNTKITTCIDPAKFGNIGRYSNHSCCPNTEIIAVRVDRTTPKLCLFAKQDIPALEEITFHYAQDVQQSVHLLSATVCSCNANNCIGYLPCHAI